jgi:hypothetical protein
MEDAKSAVIRDKVWDCREEGASRGRGNGRAAARGKALRAIAAAALAGRGTGSVIRAWRAS